MKNKKEKHEDEEVGKSVLEILNNDSTQATDTSVESKTLPNVPIAGNVEDIISKKNTEKINPNTIHDVLKKIDIASNETKENLVKDALNNFHELLIQENKPYINKNRRYKLKEEQDKFIKNYVRDKNIPVGLKHYISFYDSIIPVSQDTYITRGAINHQGFILKFSKGKAVEFINVDKQSEIKELQKCSEELSKGLFSDNKKEKDNLERALNNFYEPLLKKKEKDIDDFFEKSDHPDVPLVYTLGSPEQTVPKLKSAENPIQLESKKEEPNANKSDRWGRFKMSELSTLIQNELLEPIESLLKQDEEGNTRVLTKEELLKAYKSGSRHIMKRKNCIGETSGKDQELRKVIMQIFNAFQNEDENFLYQEEIDWGIPNEIDFQKIKKEVRSNILRASTIPRDEKTWIFSLNNQQLAQTAHGMIKMLNRNQKIKVIQSKEMEYHEKDFVSNIIQEAKKATKDNENASSDEEQWIESHNRFLERLHYSYKVDPKFKEGIDVLRETFLEQVNPEEGESFRLISSNEYTHALEFALRTGEIPITGETFFMEEFQKESGMKEGPDDYMSHSKLYENQKDSFKSSFVFPSDQDIKINTAYYKDDELELASELQALKNLIKRLFLYEEMVKFLEKKENQQETNPLKEKKEMHQFFLPGKDFSRPDKKESFKNLLPEQLFQTVENLSLENWDTNRENILQRYQYLALKGEIAPEFFMSHIRSLAENDFELLWEEVHWTKGAKYFITESKRTRDIIETVIKGMKEDFMDDEFLAQYYAQPDEITEDGEFIYFERKNYEKTDKKIPVSWGISNLIGHFRNPGSLNNNDLRGLALIIDLYPEKIGKNIMSFLLYLADSAKDRYGYYIGDTRGWVDDPIAQMFNIPLKSFDFHPEHFAQLLNESSLLNEDILTFLLGKDIEIYDNFGFSSEIEDINSFISDTVIQEMIRQNSLEGKQLDHLKVLLRANPEIAGDTILKEWKKFSTDEISSLLGLQDIQEKTLKTMDEKKKQYGLNKRATALFISLYPDFDIEIAKSLDTLFTDESVQIVFQFLKAIEKNKWNQEGIEALYTTSFWTCAPHSIKNQSLRFLLSLPKEEQKKVLLDLSGKKSTPQKNIFDIYPLNIPEDHSLFKKYWKEVKSYYMNDSSFFNKNNQIKEPEEHAQKRMSHRSKLLINDLESILKHPKEEIVRRLSTLKGFETQKAELDNTAYRLLMLVPPEDFDELFEVLESNFDSLKNIDKISKEITKYMQNIVVIHPELKDKKQKEVIQWSAEKLGIESKRRFYESHSKENIINAFRNKLKENDLGLKVNTETATEEEKNEYMSLVSIKNLLVTISENVRIYKTWLKSISEEEKNPRKMLFKHRTLEIENHENEKSESK